MKVSEHTEQKNSSNAVAHNVTEFALARYPISDTIQTKLTIGQPGDRYEQEADQVADRVMSIPDSSIQQQPLEEEEKMLQPKIQLQQIEEEEKHIQTKPMIQMQSMEDEEVPVQTKTSGMLSIPCNPSWIQTKIKEIKGKGIPLPESTRSFMESRIQFDFSKVRIHTDSNAVQMNRNLNAQAFTYGNDIYFNELMYDPLSLSGKHLLAHELTHVTQQNNRTRKPNTVANRILSAKIAHSSATNYIAKRDCRTVHPMDCRGIYSCGWGGSGRCYMDHGTCACRGSMRGASASRFRVGTCSTPRTLLTDTANVASGPDFRYLDFPTLPSLPLWKSAVLALKRRSTDFANLNDMRTELGIHAGGEGLRMVTHFASGTGSRLTHNAGSPLGSRARSSADVGRTHSAIRRLLQMQLTAMAASGAIDCGLLNLPSASVPRPHFTYSGSGPMLKGIMGGVQGFTVEMTRFVITPATRNYLISLRYLIEDDFGVDHTDLYSPGLISFWVLQHERRGYRPFVNRLDLTFIAGGRF